MSCFNIVAETHENTVVTEYIPEPRTAKAYQSETELEKEFIQRLEKLVYEYLHIKSETDLIDNVRHQIENLNNYVFSNDEWKLFFNKEIANINDCIVEKTRTIQEDNVKNLKRDDSNRRRSLNCIQS